jgi:hypothetical protein
VQLDVGGGLDVAGDQPEQVALVEHPWQLLLDTVEDPVLVGAGDGLIQVFGAPLHHLGELGPAWLAAQHGRERPMAYVRVGHAGVGELADVGGDAVQVVEGQPPGGDLAPR